jgi:hypothetical protein
MRKRESRAAAEILRAVLAKVERGELTAPRRVRARLEGAVMALEAAAPSTRRGSGYKRRSR